MTGLLWLSLLAIALGCYLADSVLHYHTEIHISVGWIAGIVLLLLLITWPISWYEDKVFKAKYTMTKETIEATREVEDTLLERAALTHKVIEINQKLAVKKYWNDGLWDWYIPDDVADLEPIH